MILNKKHKETLDAYLFLLPAIIGFLTFIIVPVILTLFYTFFEYNLIQPLEFVGLDNFRKFFEDDNTVTVFKNTFKFLFILSPMHCILGLILAYAVYKVKHDRMKNIFRGIVYFPAMVTTASVAIAFTFMFSTDTGFINYFLRQLGFENVRWLTDENTVYVTLAIFSFWKFIGNTFLYYFIGLNNIPESYYESATIDGANTFHVFTKITIPLVSPTIFFVLITNIIGVFQIFEEPYLITDGGPGVSTRTVAFHIYRLAFQENNLGYAAVFSSALFIIIMIVTVLQFIGQKKWVTYDYE